MKVETLNNGIEMELNLPKFEVEDQNEKMMLLRASLKYLENNNGNEAQEIGLLKNVAVNIASYIDNGLEEIEPAWELAGMNKVELNGNMNKGKTIKIESEEERKVLLKASFGFLERRTRDEIEGNSASELQIAENDALRKSTKRLARSLGMLGDIPNETWVKCGIPKFVPANILDTWASAPENTRGIQYLNKAARYLQKRMGPQK